MGVSALLSRTGFLFSDEYVAYDYRSAPRRLDVITQAICLSVSACCVGMRMYTKLRITKAPGWEDYTCLLAWLGLIGYAGITLEADKYGNGAHQWMVDPSDLQEFFKLANASQIAYGPLIFITKLSILLLYLRVFAPSTRSKTFICIQLLIWLNFCFYLAITLVKIFECKPRSTIWSQETHGQCVNINILILVTSIVNVVSDFLILILPIFCVWRLQMSFGKKTSTSAVFAAGIFACVSSIMRLVVSVRNSATLDRTYDWFPEFLWTSAEVTCGIIASCLPASPTFLKSIALKTRTLLSHPSTKSANNTAKKHVEMATISKQGHSHGTPVIDTGRTWEMGDLERGDGGIFQGESYTTTEARAASLSMEQRRELDIGSREGEGPRQGGILKIVEVDVSR